MANWTDFIINKRKTVVAVFFILTIIAAIAQFFVSVNYNMSDYLPDEAPSTQALEVMENEFTASVPNTRVMLEDITVQEALIIKDDLQAIEGVSEVMWLDDMVDLKIPLEMIEQDLLESYYVDGRALFSVSIESGLEVAATDAIYHLIGEEGAVAGEALNTANSQKMAGSETLFAAMLLIPIIIIILVVSTKSWIEPVFFLTAIGVSVLINLGTNIFLGEVSFVTQSVAPILQLAVSLDYAIFLLHSFADYRKKTDSPERAMQLAMKQSFPVIATSAVTTFFGFMALMLMNFEIGSDLGLNLVKGILFSFISVVVFLPALTLVFYKWMDKTKHRSFIPDFKGLGNWLLKLRYPSILLLLFILVPAFLAQTNTNFIYGMGDQPENTRAGQDEIAILEHFTQTTPIVLLVPEGDLAKEAELATELEDMTYITGVMSYVNMVGETIPPDFLEEEITEQFFSENYSRLIINTNQEAEGEIPFQLVKEVREIAASYYGDEALTLGESVALYDMKETVQRDNTVVNIMTIVTIAIVLMITFKSISIPIVLLVTIQAAVWINLAVPYFTDSSLVFVGYLIVSTVQLAATVDYGILLMETYKEHRASMSPLAAIKQSLDEKFFAIIVSASILSSVGFVLWLTSTNPVVASIGLLLGRGALLAFLMVVIVLPALLVVFDKLIRKTTYKSNFYKEEKS
ncbi:efflux RND transporter permease subunit [Alkalihalobacillus pseudalcaliphilus]|uniref:efflux RND transporter permease subunit n=1 Tax=Alkalihalobacillus pseudalcaliphilus TaxID=79884 RepID=UPI00064D7C48|nr:MMPL family transporter [Alkalihalobacillus pseudalcaliphilus]KMK76835.1 RND transporter [Alkalihalobacillus pseudalcaliphilus]